MKPINEMKLEELAAYVVTLDGWEWMPGVKTTTGRISRVLFGGGDCYWDGVLCKDPQKVVLEQYLDQHLELDGDYTSDPSGFRPDLNDPATLGCVLAMVRKKHKGNLWCEHFYALDTIEAWKVVKTRGYFNQMVADGRTEAHALVAALAKEAS